jgi:hypothetical protein
LFTSALGLQAPWQVTDIRFEPEQQVEIHFDLACEAKRLSCPACNQTDQTIHDRVPRTWQHPHFFQYKAFLHASLPRVKCGLEVETNVAIPMDGKSGAFGFGALTDGTNNVLVLTTHLLIDDSSHEHATSGF